MRISLRVAVISAVTAAVMVTAAVGNALPASATTVPFGPDVSGWQHSAGVGIDWNKVYTAGSTFAIVKATEGTYYTNSYYASDVKAARAAKLAVGAYAFARPALPISTATDQARYFAGVLGSVRTVGTLPPVLDLEVTGGLGPGDLLTWTQQYLETLRTATGRTPILYSYPDFWSSAMASTPALGRYPLWQATYSSTPPTPFTGWKAWTLWQYTSTATTAGISGASDMSRFNGTPTQLAALANGVPATAWTVTAPAAPRAVAGTPGNQAAYLRWLPSDDGGKVPDHYTVTVSPGGTHLTVPGTATHVTVPSLVAGTAYTFSVTATNTAGTSPASAVSAPVVPGRPPGVPGTPSMTTSSGTVVLAWRASTYSPTRYDVHRCTPAPCTPSASTYGTATSTAFTDRGVTNGLRYAYAVRAANRYGTSAASAIVTAAPVGPPTVPTSVTATVSGTTASLSWQQPVRNGGSAVNGYRVTVDGTTTTVGSTVRFYPVRGLAAGTHILKVAATNALGTGPTAAVTVTTAAASSSTTVLPTPTAVRLTWATPVLAGQLTRVTVRVVRYGTTTGLPGIPVTVRLAPLKGVAPAAVTALTGTGGLASVVFRPWTNATVSAVAAKTSSTASSTTSGALTVRPSVTAVLSATTVRSGTSVSLSGATSPLYAGEHLYRQGYYSGAWHNWASVAVDSTGHYRFTFTPTVVTVDRYRVVLPASTLHATGITPYRDLTVT